MANTTTKKTIQECYWYINPTTGKRFQRDGTIFRIHRAMGKATRFDPDEIGTTPKLPRTTIPVTVNEFTIDQIPKNQHWEDTIDHQKEEPVTFEDYADRLEDWEKNLLRTTGNVRNTEEVTTRIIESDNTYMVSNGGMVNGYGSYGWIIADEHEITKGRGEAEGAKFLMQSFQAEGYGMLAALRYILHAFTHTG
jgi:hypothetical protein